MNLIMVLVVLAVIARFSSTFLIPESGKTVGNLWSAFELQLQNAVFEAMDSHERPRRAAGLQDVWTAFIPDLHQQRERLIFDSFQIASSFSLCPNSSDEKVLLDSVQYRQKDYTSVACGDHLKLFGLNTLEFRKLDDKLLDGKAVSLKHFKIFDQETGDALLFILVLTLKSLEVYKVDKDTLEFTFGHELPHKYKDVELFELDDAVYCTLVEKPTDGGHIRLGLFKVGFANGRIFFDLVTSASLLDEPLIQICSIDGKGHMFHSDLTRNQLSIYFINGVQIEHHQIVEANEIKDFKCFSIGATHYLVFSTVKSIRIFQYVDGFYEALQSLPIKGVSTIQPLSPATYRDDTFLLIAGSNSNFGQNFVDILLLDASTLTFFPLNSSCPTQINSSSLKIPHKLQASNISCLAKFENLDFSSLSSIIFDQKLILIVPIKSQALLITVDVYLEPMENPAARQLVDAQKRINATALAADEVRARSEEFVKFSEGIVLYENDVRIEGSWNIGAINVPEVQVKNLANSKVEFGPLWIPGLEIVNDIQKQVTELERLLEAIEIRLEGTIMNDTSDSVEFDHLTIDGSLLINQLEVTKLSIEQLNGVDFGSLMNDVVRQDTDQMMENLEVMGTLTTNILNAEKVNGIAVSDVLVADDEELEIRGNLTIRSNISVIGNVIIGETVNGINVSQILTSGDSYDFIILTDNTTVKNLSVGGHINGVNTAEVLLNAIVNQTVDAHLDQVHFDHLTIEGDLNIKSGLVNEIDIVYLNTSALRLNANQLVEGSMVFTQGIAANQLLKVGSINGVRFEDLITKNTNLSKIVMTGQKTFMGKVNSRLLNIEGVVNGHHLHNALTYDTNQSVSGTVRLVDGFESPTADLSIETLNDIDWESVHEKGVHPALLKLHGLKKNVTIRNLCSIGGSLTAVKFKVNGENLDDVLDDIVYANGDDITVTGEKTFASIKMNGLQVDGYLNGLKVLDEILTSSTDQTITGHYKFEKYVDFSSLEVKGHLNQYSLDELLGSVLQFDGDLETVTCRLRFNHLTVSDQILINGSINGFPTTLMVLDGVNQTFTAPQKLVSPDFSSLIIKGHLNTTDHTGHINGIDLDLFDRRRATLSTDQWIRGSWNLNDFTADTVSFGTLNSLSLDEWNSSFIQSHSPSTQKINSIGFDLESLEVWGNVVTLSKEINGYDLHKLSQVAGDIRESLVFSTNVSFTHLESKEVVTNGTVNNLIIERIERDAVYRNQTPHVIGTKIFEKLRVKGDVDTILINGHRLIDSYLHVSADQKIEAPIEFANQVTAGDLKLEGNSASLNGVPKQLLFSSHTLTHNVHRGDIIFEKPIEVESLEISSLHGENWDQLVSSLARVNEANQFNETVTFTEPVKIKGVLTVGKLNGINLSKFAEDIVLADVDATIISKKSFDKIETPLMSTLSLKCHSVYPDVIDTAERAIRLDVNDIVNRTIQLDTVTVNRNVQSFSLNGLSFPSSFVTLDSEQSLPHSTEIDRLVMLGDIVLEDGAKVNGFNLKAECANTWMVDGTERIESNKVFQGQVQLLGNLTANQKVNGVTDFGDEVITLTTGGAIYGAPHFIDLVVSDSVANVRLTNDINLTDLAARALYLDEPINTNGTWKMTKASVHGGSFLLPVEAKINQQPLSVGQLIGEVTGAHELRLLQLEEQQIYNVAREWRNALRDAYFKMDHFELNQTIVLPHQVTALSEMESNGSSLLFIGTRGGSMVYRKKATEMTYELAGIPPDTGNVTKWLTLSQNYAVSLARTGTKLWRVSSNDLFRIELVQDLGSNVVDITDEAIHNLRSNFNGGVSQMNLAINQTNGLEVYERQRTLSENSSSPFNSDVKMHSFAIGSKSMIALVMTFSPHILANVVGCPGVRLYSTSTLSLKLEHIIPACDVRAITTFSHGNLPDHYLVMAEHEAVTIHVNQGASGYVLHSSLPYTQANVLLSWSIKSGTNNDLFLAVGKTDRVAIHRAVTVGDYVKD